MFNRRSNLAEKADFSNESAGTLDEFAAFSNPVLDGSKTSESERRKPEKTEDRPWVYKKSCEMNQSAFGNLLLSPRLTPACRVVLNWFIKHLGNKNFVGASYPKIAKSAKISVASVRRGCAVLEDKDGVNFMVRVSVNTRSSLWMVNPEYFWKGFRSEHASGKAMYNNYRKKSDADDDTSDDSTKDASDEEDSCESELKEF